MTHNIAFNEIAWPDIGLLNALEQEGLPTSDLGHAGQRFWRLEGTNGIIGYAGIERHGRAGLMRSVVILPHRKGKGLGRVLVEQAVAAAWAAGIDDLWLLTNTAANFFDKLGWQRRQRSEAPDAIAASAEFAGLCPATATCLSLRIRSSPD